MKRINCIVEGQTEETFVEACLAPSLGSNGLFISARCVETGRKGPRIYRGGLVSYQKAKADILTWIKQDPSAYVTTMFDYYRIPSEFPGFSAAQAALNPVEKAHIIEHALALDIDSPRFLPYIQMHEFEGILFSDTDVMESVLSPTLKKTSRHTLHEIRSQFETPEHINGGSETAPSKRLLSMYCGYDKVLHGSLIATRIGIDRIRSQCVNFERWIGRMSAL